MVNVRYLIARERKTLSTLAAAEGVAALFGIR
jgi:hypothetical protein